MSEVTERDLAVWSAYLGSALSLDPKVHDIGDKARKAITKAKASIDSGGNIDRHAVADAAQLGIDGCELEEGSHPSVVSKVRVVATNLGAVIEQISDGKAKATAPKPAKDAPAEASDGKVDCPCGKRHDEGSKVLARHQKSAAKG